MTKILNRFSRNLICEEALLNLKELAVKNKANLWGANLRGANLREANLWGADLREANLWGANLRGANLWGANLWGADLREANLWGANLREANLWGADLREANLWGADLREANLRGADLREANLWGADLRGARINDKKIINYKEIVGIGNSRRQLRCFMLDDDSFYFMAGCFLGTEKELKAKVLEKYGKDCEYMEAIKFLKKLCKNYKYN